MTVSNIVQLSETVQLNLKTGHVQTAGGHGGWRPSVHITKLRSPISTTRGPAGVVKTYDLRGVKVRCIAPPNEEPFYVVDR